MAKELPRERLLELYDWYSKLGQPNKNQMKKKLQQLAPNISPNDIDKLPWIAGGAAISAKKIMSDMFALRH